MLLFSSHNFIFHTLHTNVCLLHTKNVRYNEIIKLNYPFCTLSAERLIQFSFRTCAIVSAKLFMMRQQAPNQFTRLGCISQSQLVESLVGWYIALALAVAAQVILAKFLLVLLRCECFVFEAISKVWLLSLIELPICELRVSWIKILHKVVTEKCSFVFMLNKSPVKLKKNSWKIQLKCHRHQRTVEER